VALIITINVNERARFLIDAQENSRRGRFGPQIVLIDCGSSEGAKDLAAKFPRIVSRRLENVRHSVLRSSVLAELSSQFVIFLDMDDRLTPIAIEAGLKCFDKNPDAVLVFGGTESSTRRTSCLSCIL
jgi:glycosyltransferase involved in cell wall biosynthesis